MFDLRWTCESTTHTLIVCGDETNDAPAQYPESMLDEHEQSELASMAGHGLTPVATAAPAPTTRPLAAIRTSSPKRANQSVPFQPTNPPGLLRGLRKEPSLAEVLFGESDSTTAAKGRAVKPLTGKQKGKARMRDDEDQDMTVHDEDGDWETIPDGWLEDLVPIQDSNVSIAAASRPQLAPPGPRQPSKPIKKFAAVIDIPDDDMDHVEGTVIAHQKRTSKTPLRQQQSRQITQEEQAEEFGIMNVGKSPAKGLILLSDLSVDDQDKCKARRRRPSQIADCSAPHRRLATDWLNPRDFRPSDEYAAAQNSQCSICTETKERCTRATLWNASRMGRSGKSASTAGQDTAAEENVVPTRQRKGWRQWQWHSCNEGRSSTKGASV